jgi:2-polyprenyl-6-methoxyphenol hydroxylase-like FAD-dependent oxidoreductase
MKVLIVGAGICGLGTALLLARDGHEITVLERDGDPLPASPRDAWESWERKGVAQFRQPHNFMPGLRLLLETELPEIQDALVRAGTARFDLLNPLPPSLADRSPRPIDAQLWTQTGRRPVCEWVFADAVGRQRRVSVRHGARVAGLLTGPSARPGTPHVIGVRTTTGEELTADLVVDASGRQSPCPQWLTAIGARPPYEEQEESGFTYYTRYFCGQHPQRVGPVLSAFESFSLLTLPGDNNTWSVTLFTATGDQPLKNLRHEEAWTRVVRACPLHAHWLDGEPITPVLPMSGVVDRYRRFVVDGGPVATGLVAVADAWACTNPSAGRGLTVGFLHARQLRDVLRDAEDPCAIVEEFDRRTEAEVAPWYHAQIAMDRARFADMEAARDGRPVPPPAPLVQQIGSLLSTFMLDPDLFRAGLEYIGTITPIQTILKRPEVAERIRAVFAVMKNVPLAVPGPNRAQLLDILSGSGAGAMSPTSTAM